VLRCAPLMDNFRSARDSVRHYSALYGCYGEGKFAYVAAEGT